MTRVRRSWDVTERQRSVLAAIRAHIANHGEAPTVREIAAAVGLASPSAGKYSNPSNRTRSMASLGDSVALCGSVGSVQYSVGSNRCTNQSE
ncbi:hypothetical protein [Streptomyces sp. NBC_00269]|uniref:LexA family protein n=1 Tax=Streptomyces sp. NBC_00269 TaxID=2975696 RepID=UPI003FA75C5B